MDLNSGRPMTRRKVTQLPVTPSVIKAVEAMAAKQGMKSLKFKNRHKVIFHPADWIAGVDYTDNDDDENNNNNWRNGNRFEALADDDDDDSNDDDYEYDDDEEQELYDEDFDEDDGYDRPDQQEIDELLAERSNPIVETVNEDDEADEESEPAATRRSTRATAEPARLEPKFTGQSYAQTKKKKTKKKKKKKVTFAEDQTEQFDELRVGLRNEEDRGHPDQWEEGDPGEDVFGHFSLKIGSIFRTQQRNKPSFCSSCFRITGKEY